jgi:hypothetical protein
MLTRVWVDFFGIYIFRNKTSRISDFHLSRPAMCFHDQRQTWDEVIEAGTAVMSRRENPRFPAPSGAKAGIVILCFQESPS